MNEIQSISDIQQLLTNGFANWKELGDVSVSAKGDLRIFNYTQHAQFEARWNYFEQVSRGLILNAITGEIVARPFDKFFNFGEGGRSSAADIVSVTEKLDGSLGILYRDNGYKIATRGSFDSDQAQWATEFLNKNYDLSGLPGNLALLFEIIYPDNRIVVNYNGREDLVLLAIRNRFTGSYYSPWSAVESVALAYGFSLPKVYQFKTAEQIIEAAQALDPNSEGWVVEFADGQRFKFKGEEYKKLHRLISALSFKNTLECCASGTLDELRAIVPDEFMTEVNVWIEQIETRVEETKQAIESAFSQAPKETRKDFALWVIQNHKPLAPYLFARLDNRPVEALVYKLAFREALEAEPEVEHLS